jgi:hypothetical protein
VAMSHASSKAESWRRWRIRQNQSQRFRPRQAGKTKSKPSVVSDKFVT